MPLPCIQNGTKKCQCKSKRTGLPCNNPAAFGQKACRMHGAHRIKNAPRGSNHPQFKDGSQTREERNLRRKKSLMFQRLEEIGRHLDMFTGTKTRGRKVGPQLNLEDENQLLIALIQSKYTN
jgi:hypothetical protein